MHMSPPMVTIGVTCFNAAATIERDRGAVDVEATCLGEVVAEVALALADDAAGL